MQITLRLSVWTGEKY